MVPRLMDRARAVTDRFDLICTVHAPGRLSLACLAAQGDPATENAVSSGCVEFCAAIGAGVLAYHSGLIGLHEAAVVMAKLSDQAALEAASDREVAVLRELRNRTTSPGTSMLPSAAAGTT